MSIADQNHSINLIPGIFAPVVVHCSQGDVGRKIKLNVYNGSEPFDLTGADVDVHGVRADGGWFTPATASVSGNMITFNLTASMTAVEGGVLAEIGVSKSRSVIGSANFCMLVEKATFAEGVTYANDVSVYESILTYVKTQFGSMSAQFTSLGNRIDAANSRIDGIIALRDGSTTGDAELQDIRVGVDGETYATAGEAVRTQTSEMRGEVDAVKTEYIGDAYNPGYEIAAPTTTQDGAILTAVKGKVFTHDSASNGKIGYVTVEPGDMYSVRTYVTAGYGTNGRFALVATTAANIVVSAVAFSNTESGYVENSIVIPAGAVRLWISGYAATTEQFAKLTTITRYARITLAEEIADTGRYYRHIRDVDLSGNITVNARIKSGLKIGDTIDFTTGSTSHFAYGIASVTPGKTYKVTVREPRELDGYSVALTNSAGVIRRLYLPKTGVAVQNASASCYITIPEGLGVSKMYVQSYVGTESGYLNTTKVELVEKMSVADGLVKAVENLGRKTYRTTGEVVDLTAGFAPGKHITNSADAIGETIQASDNVYYSYSTGSVKPGQSYKITIRQSANRSVPWVYFCAGDTIIGTAVDPEGISRDWSGVVTIPMGASSIFIQSYHNENNYLRLVHCEAVELVEDLDISEEHAKPVNAADNLPPYYTQDWIDVRMNAVKENTRVKSGVSFGFVTDTHVIADRNNLNSMYLARNILDKTSVPYFIFGGDVIWAYGTRADMEEQAERWRTWCKYVGKVYQIRGNHDYHAKISQSEDAGYTAPEEYVYDYLMRDQELSVEVGAPGAQYFMLENKAQKVRILCISGYGVVDTSSWLTTGRKFPQAEVDWVIDKLTEVEGYSFIVITHASPDTEITAGGGLDTLMAIEKAVNGKTAVDFTETIGGETITAQADFSDTTNEIVCNISGHNHRDEDHVSDGVLSITTTCDATIGDDPNTERNRNTTSENAFDVFSIDTTSRTIKTVRFGGGVSRTWAY